MTRDYRIDGTLLFVLRENLEYLAGRGSLPSAINKMRQSCLEQAWNAIQPAIGCDTPVATIEALKAGVLSDLKRIAMDAEVKLQDRRLLEYVEAGLDEAIADQIDFSRSEPDSCPRGEASRPGAEPRDSEAEPDSCVRGKAPTEPAEPAPRGSRRHPRSIYDPAVAARVQKYLNDTRTFNCDFARAAHIDVQTLSSVLQGWASKRTWAEVEHVLATNHEGMTAKPRARHSGSYG
jgi:hypothetical protein